ncbi:MAG: glycosyltransferase family 39 protein [Deltaproteobacteria bacterium]|nr:glycosyltransferase family 39 protein [Deltaproteobacteria bacterium]
MMQADSHKVERNLFALILFSALARLAAGHWLGLGYGESYYFSLAAKPSLSYFDQPPLSLWLAAVSMKLFGAVTPLVLRLPFILLFAGSTYLIYAIGKKMFGAWPGFYAALLLNVSAVFGVSTGIFFQPESPLIFFWLTTVWCLIKLFFDPSLKNPYFYWAATGILFGLGLLSKYPAIFLPIGAFLFLLTTPPQRGWLKHPGPYLAILISVLLFAPVLIWNAQHEWISLLWQGHRGVDYKGIHLIWLLRSILGQAAWVLPWIWIPLIFQLYRCFKGGPALSKNWFIAWMSVVPIVVFTAISLWTEIGYHFHWQAPGYLMLFLPLGDSLFRLLQNGSQRARRWLIGSTAFSSLALLIVVTHVATGWGRGIEQLFASDESKKLDDPTLEMLDYSTLEEALRGRGLLARKDLFVFTNRWFQSGKVDYALKGKMPLFCFHPSDQRGFEFLRESEEWLGKDGVLVSTQKKLDNPHDAFGEYFEEIIPLGFVTVPRGKYIEETLYLHYCRNYRKVFPKAYVQK